MAVVSAREAPRGTGGQLNDQGQRNRTRVFLVQVDSALDGSVTVEAGVPVSIGDSYRTPSGEFDNGIVCIGKTSERHPQHRLIWYVTVYYSSDYQSLVNILNEPPEIDIGTEFGTESIMGIAAEQFDGSASASDPGDGLGPTSTNAGNLRVKIYTAQGVRNSAGQVFNPPFQKQISSPVVRYTRNQASFLIADKVKYENAVNLTTWNGLAARQAKCRSITAQAMYFQPPTVAQLRIIYYRVTYEFGLKAETWDLCPLDAGSYYLDWRNVTPGPTAEPKKIEFRTSSGAPDIGLLDHSDSQRPGKKLAAGQPAQYLNFKVYRAIDFTPLTINLNLAITAVRARARAYTPAPDPSKTPTTGAS